MMSANDVSDLAPSTEQAGTHLACAIRALSILVGRLARISRPNDALKLFLVGDISAHFGDRTRSLFRLLFLCLHEAEDRVAELVRNLAAQVQVWHGFSVSLAAFSSCGQPAPMHQIRWSKIGGNGGTYVSLMRIRARSASVNCDRRGGAGAGAGTDSTVGATGDAAAAGPSAAAAALRAANSVGSALPSIASMRGAAASSVFCPAVEKRGWASASLSRCWGMWGKRAVSAGSRWMLARGRYEIAIAGSYPA